VACDSCGGVGSKKWDAYKVPPVYVGGFSARVVLLELICAGAKVVALTDNICNEMDNTGKEIIAGIKKELKAAGIEDVILTGSTEENFATVSTAVGMTAVGLADQKDLKVNSVRGEAVIISAGVPKVGKEIDLEGDSEIIDYKTLYGLLKNPSVYEIVPVGSRGIAYEAGQLALYNNLRCHINDDCGVDVQKSGGPETSVIAAVDGKAVRDILQDVPETHVIGYLRFL
jgi:hypothetical protein